MGKGESKESSEEVGTGSQARDDEGCYQEGGDGRGEKSWAEDILEGKVKGYEAMRKREVKERFLAFY